MTVMISLIGEQPIPNLLPIRRIQPDEVLLLYTKRTEATANRLKRLVEMDGVRVHMLSTDPYDIQRARADLEGYIRDQGWTGSALVFNLTGGTKTMVLAAYQIAMALGAPFVYLQSEGRQSRLYRYEFVAGDYQKGGDEVLPGLITIDDYLRAHVGDYETRKPRFSDLGTQFEEAIESALVGWVDEVKRGVLLGGALEVDLVVRLGNQVGVIQAKTGRKAKEKDGLRELNAACAREYLGTYTAKILVINQEWDHTVTNLRDLANAWNITVVQLPSFTESSPSLSPGDQEELRRAVRGVLGG